jgi:hypothetical protein
VIGDFAAKLDASQLENSCRAIWKVDLDPSIYNKSIIRYKVPDRMGQQCQKRREEGKMFNISTVLSWVGSDPNSNVLGTPLSSLITTRSVKSLFLAYSTISVI